MPSNEALNVIGSISAIVDSITTFGLLVGIIYSFLTNKVASRAAYTEMVREKDQACEALCKEKDRHREELIEGHKTIVETLRCEADQEVTVLRELLEEREKRYMAVIASLENSANLERDVASLIRTIQDVKNG